MSSYRVCLKCNTVYNHQIEFCFVDGEELHLSKKVNLTKDVPQISNITSNITFNVEATDILPFNKQPIKDSVSEFDDIDEVTDWELQVEGLDFQKPSNGKDKETDLDVESLVEDYDLHQHVTR